MADIEQSTPVDTPGDDVAMEEGDGAQDASLTELEPEAPKLVLFSEYVAL